MLYEVITASESVQVPVTSTSYTSVDLVAQEDALVGLYERVSPGVVTVLTFYDDLHTSVAQGTGSGFVWDDQGHIVTNYHVIEDGDMFVVTLANQEQKQARLVGKEVNKDIAVLKIEA